MQRIQSLGIDPIVDYVFPIWPTINCFNPARSDNSQVVPSASFTSYLTAVQNKAKQFTQSGLFFTAQCAPGYVQPEWSRTAHVYCHGILLYQ